MHIYIYEQEYYIYMMMNKQMNEWKCDEMNEWIINDTSMNECVWISIYISGMNERKDTRKN